MPQYCHDKRFREKNDNNEIIKKQMLLLVQSPKNLCYGL